MTRIVALAFAFAVVSVVAAATEAGASVAAPPRAITLLHHGRSFDLNVGRSVSVRLPNARRVWSTPRAAGGGAASIHPVNYVRDPGFVEWRVAATAPGRVTLTSLGRCDDCPLRVRRFRVTLVVRS